MKKETVTIAIDFGTSKTQVCGEKPGERMYEFCFGMSDGRVPTSVLLTSDGRLLFGDDAEAMACICPDGYCSNFKNQLGNPAPILGEFRARKLVELFLAYLLEKVCEDVYMQDAEITKVVMTYPLAFSPQQKAELCCAALSAGWRNVCLVSEPEAYGATYSFTQTSKAFKRAAIIVNWGAGCAEVAHVVRADNGDIVVRAKYSVNDSSAEVLDDKLQKLVESALKKNRVDVEVLSAAPFREDVRELKNRLCAVNYKTYENDQSKELIFSHVHQGLVYTAGVRYVDWLADISNCVGYIKDGVVGLMKKAAAKERAEMVLLTGGMGLSEIVSYLVAKKVPTEAAGYYDVEVLKTRRWACYNPSTRVLDSSYPAAILIGALLLARLRRPEAVPTQPINDSDVILPPPPSASKVDKPEIFRAVATDDVQELQRLIDSGANVNMVGKYGATPLWHAVERGYLDCVRLLLSAGATPDIADRNGVTVLQKAIKENRPDCLRELIAAGADVNRCNNNGWQPLWYAAYKGHAECVQNLLAARGIKADEKNAYGITPLSVALKYGHRECVRLIRNHLK
ncbi:MAG: ankyrin repeat domain-containing protein [Akkermansia sp.]|nr:ankyrin repeat domain-containing protein [Akkermansia sp.]